MGYVEGEFTNQSLEDVAEAYILCLLKQGFFYCDERNIYECPMNFWMHNLMHDLVLSIAGFKYKMADSVTDEFDERVCHVSYASVPESPWAYPSSLFKIKQLKTLLLPYSTSVIRPSRVRFFPGHEIFLLRVQSLRVLRMSWLSINKLPRTLGKLIHLRYLDISFNSFRKLPESVTQLVNLYLLNLSRCKNLEELPKDIHKLVMLRHLLINGCRKLSHMPKGLGRLIGLETLEYFVIGKASNSLSLSGSKIDLVCGLAELCHLDNIKGTMNINLDYRSKNIISEAKAANLHKKEKITCFRLNFRGSAMEDEMVFDNLKPGANLTRFEIKGYDGKQLPCWMREGIHCWLPNLVYVEIFDCNGCIYLCSFGRLPHLKSLTLMNMDKLEYIENGSGSNNDNTIVLVDEHSSTPLFPSLEDFHLANIPKLKGWWSVTDIAQDDGGLNQLQKWIPAFPKLEKVTMDMMELLVKVFPQGIDSLRSLIVYSFSETAEQSGILLRNHFPMLQGLRFYNIKVLPDELKGMSSLESLSIDKCKCLEAIPDWIDSLTSLTELSISGCPSLKSLPSQRLIIRDCSCELVDRCQWPTGQDWPKIHYICIVSPNNI